MRVVRWTPWLLLAVALGVAGWVGWDAVGSWREAHEPQPQALEETTSTAATTTTTLATPTSTSTSTTTTTLPTATTTTEVEVVNITGASGLVTCRGRFVADLGLISDDRDDELVQGFAALARGMSLGSRVIEDWQGHPQEVTTLVLVLGTAGDGGPYTREFIVGVPDWFVGPVVGVVRHSSSEVIESGLDASADLLEGSEAMEALTWHVDRHREMVVYFYLSIVLPDSPSYAQEHPDNWDLLLELTERLGVTRALLSDLRSGHLAPAQSDDLGFIWEIHLLDIPGLSDEPGPLQPGITLVVAPDCPLCSQALAAITTAAPNMPITQVDLGADLADQLGAVSAPTALAANDSGEQRGGAWVGQRIIDDLAGLIAQACRGLSQTDYCDGLTIDLP